jgi:hypothetical protein
LPLQADERRKPSEGIMEQRDDKWRGLKSAGADGGDLLQAQARMWMELGEVLAGMLRRMRRRAVNVSVAQDGADGEAGERPAGDRDAA